jgi:hypothetical protein
MRTIFERLIVVAAIIVVILNLLNLAVAIMDAK